MPEGPLHDQMGDVELVIKISKAPLEEDIRGISIYSKGVWYETTLAGSEGREMANHIFGDIDVSKLDEDQSPIAPFDVSRSMRLNPNNELVRAMYAFIGQTVEEIRRELAQAEKQRRANEDARKLASQADEIAKVINEDFDAFRQRVAKAKAKASGGADLQNKKVSGGTEDTDLIFGSEVPAVIVSPTGGIGTSRSATSPSTGNEPRTLAPLVAPDSGELKKQGRPVGGSGGARRPHGGFGVKFDNLGSESHHTQYVRDERTIYINLDHPQLTAAKGHRSIEDPVFRRLAYEIAFSEYAVALA